MKDVTRYPDNSQKMTGFTILLIPSARACQFPLLVLGNFPMIHVCERKTNAAATMRTPICIKVLNDSR